MRRDITRVCEYFARQGVRANPGAIMARLWDQYGRELAEALAFDGEADFEPEEE